jgi:penicillin-binding protein 1A
LAVKLEREHSKERILGFYLNTVYFGRGAYGAEAAARSYFDKSAIDLTLSEAAYLAGAIRAPERYQPDRDPEAAEAIRQEVLEDMVEAGYLSSEEAEAARSVPAEFRLTTNPETQTARSAYFVEFIKGKLYDEFELADADIFGGGLEIHTTLDPKMQKAAEDAVASTLDRDTDPETALVAVDTDGRVRAMVGGRVVDSVERARGTNFAFPRGGGGRQAGSAFKPFTLATFIDQGYSIRSVFTAPELLEVQAPQCRDRAGKNWLLTNFGDRGYAPMDVTEATARSINTVYAQMMEITKPRDVTRMAEAAGITSPLDRVCALTLGTSDVTPLEMARAYATFANRGERPDLLYVTKIVTADGRVIHEAKPNHERTIDAGVADTVNHVLQRVVASGTANRQKLSRATAAKTGTTQNFRDAWFVGYTPQLSVAVWMGYAIDSDGKIKEMTNVRGQEVTGGTLPGIIWRRFMEVALEDIEAAAFRSPRISGEEIKPSPIPCPTTSPGASPGPYPGAFCATPSPEPSPSPNSQPSPTPSPEPTPSPTPSGGE